MNPDDRPHTRAHPTLHRLRASTPGLLLALSAMITGCATIRPARPVMSPGFAEGSTPVTSVALLPVDLRVQKQGEPSRPPELDRRLLQRGVDALVSGLHRRGYPVVALLDTSGGARTPAGKNLGVVIHTQDLAALRVRLHDVTRGYQTAALRADERNAPELAGKVHLIEASIDPALTASLGRLTGADASLYTRAWAYIVPGDGGASAAKVLLAVLAIVAVVGVIAMLFAGGKSKGRGRRSSRSRRSRGLRSRRGGSGVRLAANIGAAIGEVIVHSTHSPAQPPPCHSCDDSAPQPAPTLQMMSATPARSTAGMAMSLVDNRDGRVLWHVEQRVPIALEGTGDVERLVDHFLRALPPR